MAFNCLNIIGTDEESKTILAESVDGSIILDTIPAAVNYMKNKTGYTMLLKSYMGIVFEVAPDSTIESAEKAWLDAQQVVRHQIFKSTQHEINKTSEPQPNILI